MDYSFPNQVMLAQLGLATLKVQTLEEQVTILQTALKMTLGSLDVGAEGMDMGLMTAASEVIERFKAPDPEGDTDA